MKKEKIVILGAGLAGLSAAYHLERLNPTYHYQIFEKEDVLGGLCRSKKVNGFTFDCDGHLLHFKHQSTLKLLKELVGDFIEHQRSSWVYYSGSYIPYPFQANLFGLPSQIVKSCLLSFIQASNNGKNHFSQKASFKDWILKTFGQGIADHFMLPYNQKFWTVPLESLNCHWIDGFIPVPKLEELIEGALGESRKRYGYNASFWYPAKGGIQEVALAFSRRIKKIEAAQEAKTIDLNKKRVIFKDGRKIRYDKLVSTIPLPEMAKLIGNLPERIICALGRLKWTSIFNLNLGVNRKDLSDKHWIYFPDQKFIFYRVGFPHNFSCSLTPPEKTSIYAEVAHSEYKPLDRNQLIQRIIKDLQKAKILFPKDKILVEDINDLKYGYVIYDKNREAAVKTAKDFLEQQQVFSLGRFGSWKYMSMEDSILEGKNIINTLFA